MSRSVRFDPHAWDQYLAWQTEDKRTLRRINDLIKAIQRDPSSGDGSPEELHGDLSGCWSRRINQKDRLVYRVRDDVIEIAQCRGHYTNR